MRILIVTYCFGTSHSQLYKCPAQIGTYKRGLRLAKELTKRGHGVFVFCTGRHFYHDDLTESAEKSVHFIDFPCQMNTHNDIKQKRGLFLKWIRDLGMDMIIAGEAPMAGTLLESTLCAVELEIPVVILDNAYFPGFANYFYNIHGSIADGIILNGPSSFCTPNQFSILLEIPPFIESSPQAAKDLLSGSLGLKGDKLITVLAYDRKIEKLGVSLLERLNSPEMEGLFFSPNPEECKKHLEKLPAYIREKIRVIAPPPDPTFFGLLELSRLAVVKSGFMQVIECLVLHTPIIGLHFEGFFSLTDLPKICESFVHATYNPDADSETTAAAQRFLDMPPEKMKNIHNNDLNASAVAADFIENMSRVPRKNTTQECEKLGFKKKYIIKALSNLNRSGQITFHFMRCALLRNFPEYRIYTLVCSYFKDGKKEFSRLWCRVYKSRKAAMADVSNAKSPDSGRRLIYFSAARHLLIEEDIGEWALPGCIL